MAFILSNQKKIFWSLVLFCLAVVALRNYQYVSIARDVYWHVKMGLDLIDKGLTPFIDHYSVEYFGKPFEIAPPVPFQVFLALIYKIVPNESFISFALTLIFFSTLLVFIYISKKLKFDIWLTSLGVILIANVLVLRPLLRPEIMSYLFEMLAVVLGVSALKNWKRKKALMMAALLATWSFYHASVVFGFAVIGAIYIELVFKKLVEKDFIKLSQLVVWGLFTFCMGFMSADHLHPIITGLQFDKRWIAYILEYSNFLKGITIGYLLQVFMVAGLALHIKSRNLAYFIITLVLFYNTEKINKLFPHTFIVCTPLLLISLKEVLSDLPKKLNRKLPIYKSILILCVFVAFLKSLVSAKIWENYRRDHWKSAPVSAADYFEKNNIMANVYGSLEGGGYFIYRNSPNIKVAIDGRSNILYDIDFFEKIGFSAKSVGHFIQLWKEDKYQYISVNYLSYPFVMDTALRVGGYDIVLEDGYFALFRKGENRFPLFRQVLLYPGCIDQLDVDSLTKEFELFNSIEKSKDSVFKKVIPLAIEYIKAENKARFIGQYPLKLNDLDLFQVRILSQIYLTNGFKSRAFLIYNVFSDQIFLERDKLTFALLLTEMIDGIETQKEDFDKKVSYLKSIILGFYPFEVTNLTPLDKGVFLEVIDRYEKLSGEKIEYLPYKLDKLRTRYATQFELAKTISAKDVFSRNCHSETELRVKNF